MFPQWTSQRINKTINNVYTRVIALKEGIAENNEYNAEFYCPKLS